MTDSPQLALLAQTLARIEGNLVKLDEQMQCVRTALTHLDGGLQMLLGADNDDDDETDDEATHSTSSDDASASDLSYITDDHSSEPAYDTQDSA